MQATAVAFVIAVSAWLPHIWWIVPAPEYPVKPTTSVEVGGELHVRGAWSNAPELDCPECECAPPPTTPLKVCSPCAAESSPRFSPAVVGIAGVAAGAVAARVVQYGGEDRAGAEAGAAFGDPIPW